MNNPNICTYNDETKGLDPTYFDQIDRFCGKCGKHFACKSKQTEHKCKNITWIDKIRNFFR